MGAYVTDNPFFFPFVALCGASPATLPYVATLGLRFTPHFPYGYIVDPD